VGKWPAASSAGDRRVVGRTIALAGLPMTVVGVIPAAFLLPSNSDLSPGDVRDPDVWLPIGRLRPGVTHEAAQAELAVARGKFWIKSV
jgi:hypothetical protein